MSDALTAAMEGFCRMSRPWRAPREALRKTLEAVRGILSTHRAELVKLGRNRDLERLRDITLPREIMQADYQVAMQNLNAKEQLKETTPAQFKEGLQEIQTKFADYLKAHPDRALQLQLRIKGATEEELKAPLEKWRKLAGLRDQLGVYDGDMGIGPRSASACNCRLKRCEFS